MFRKKASKSIASKIWILVVGVVILTTGLVCSALVLQERKAIRTSTTQRMIDIANCASGSVDGDILKTITAEDEDTEEYKRIYDALAVYRDNVELEYVYGIKDEGDGTFTFTVDPAIDDPAPFGKEVVRTDALYMASQGIAAADNEFYEDEWGSFYSAYSPVFDSEGKVAGIIGIDFSREWYDGQLKEQTRNQVVSCLIIVAVVLVMSVILISMLLKSIMNPLKNMALVAKNYEKGLYDDEFEVGREDELGDISRALQSMASSLTEHIKEAEAANNAKSDFLAHMSHEIRTPINAVLGMNEMILRESNDGEILEYSENIKTSGTMLLGIINDILDFSKIESGKLEIIPVDYDLSTILNDLVHMIQTRADDKGLMFKLDFDSNIPRLLHGDEIRIKQIITNILTNAVKYTEKGSVTFSMGYDPIENDPDSIMLHVSVKDTGMGIKEEDMKKLFSEFERIEEKKNRNIEGTGLGMSITKSLLEMMDSSLQVESVYGEGSVFSFSIKQRVVGEAVLGNYEEAYKEHLNRQSKYKEIITAPAARILVVDDNKMNLVVFKSLVKQTLIHVDTAESGDEGLEQMSSSEYDIIFLDHLMPNKDGIETLHDLKKQSDNPNIHTPVICLTANAISGAREQYISEGFDDYLTKPIDPVRLEELLVNLLPEEKLEYKFNTFSEDTNETQEKDKDYEVLEILEKQNLIDLERGISNTRSKEAYLSFLKMFSDELNDRIVAIENYYSEGDIDNYKIRVHALKSSAYLVGIMEVGELAQRLEAACNEGDTEYVNEHHGVLMEELMKYQEILQGLFAGEENDSSMPEDEGNMPEADEELMSKVYDDMKAAADDLDSDRLEEIFSNMEKYSIPTQHRELFERLRALSKEYEYAAISELLTQER